MTDTWTVAAPIHVRPRDEDGYTDVIVHLARRPADRMWEPTEDEMIRRAGAAIRARAEAAARAERLDVHARDLARRTETLACAHCGADFTTAAHHARFCSTRCRMAAHRAALAAR